MSEPIEVPCTCPAQVDDKGRVTRPVPVHEHDEVWPKDTVDAELGTAVVAAMRVAGRVEVVRQEDMVTAAMNAYVPFGIGRWTFVDEDGAVVPIDRGTAARYLPWPTVFRVADLIDDIHGATILDPFRPESSRRPASGPTESSTSPIPSPGDDPESPRSAPPSLRAVSGGKRRAS